MRQDTFIIQPRHGRVYKHVGYRLKVLVGIPGDVISLALAKECGLVEEPKPEPRPEPPNRQPAKSPAAKKAPGGLVKRYPPKKAQ